ncbi:methionyl-tRNA formyltransferase [Rubrivivax rivuli]|uniref:Methionyl-tRNA formyltransferase n=1 Tax=Rubrivivax rivuli TaxID=1862385 RepID=A0A437RM15_9BURK|nr:methionyl-tRNA formyltransferase [Rubrivivax rivuli]RVU47848.1 methionyl-tRNA formyltransferase [Rubrivivax rivuli]
MRVGYAGTPEFARVALQALVEAGATVPLVLTQPDRPAGRGLKLQASPVKQLAQAHGLPLAQPRSLRLDGKYPDDAAAARQALQAAALDVMVVAAYGLILPAWVLATPRHGCLNIHGSLLPRWRGAAPIQRAIEAGDAETGITLMQMDEGLDTGDMLLVEATPIGADDTTTTLHDRLAALGARLMVQGLRQLRGGTLRAVPQPAEGATYARKIEKAEAQLDWREAAAVLERRLRAFDPFPGGAVEWQGQPLKLWRARVLADAAPAGMAPGTWLPLGEGRLALACGEGALEWLEVQPAGGRRMGVRDFLQRQPRHAG